MILRILVLLIACSSLAYPQVSKYKMYNISSEDGLLGDNVECILQDSYGFLWLGGFDGLSRGDGQNFRKYVHKEGDSKSLSQNIIYSVFEDKKKRLWVGSIEGLDKYDRETDSFQKVDLKLGNTRIPLKAIAEDSDGMLWLGTSNGLCKFDPESKSVKWYYESLKPDSLRDNVIFSVVCDKQQNVWIGTFNKGLFKYSINSGKFQSFSHQEQNDETICSNKIKSLLIDHENNIWVGTFDKGVSKLSNTGKVLKHYSDFNSKGVSENLVSRLYEDKHQTIWICKENELLQFLEKGKEKFSPFENAVVKKYQLQCKGINAIMEDNFGNTWFGSQVDGLFYTNEEKNNFKHYFHNYVTKKGLSDDVVTCIFKQDATHTWIGTYHGGINLLNEELDNYQVFKTGNGLSSNFIHDIIQDKAGMLWIASWNGGLMRMNPKTKKVDVFTNQIGNENSLIYNNIKSIVLQDSLLWIGTHGEGLCVYNLITKKFIHHRNNKTYPFNMLEPSWINHLFLDSKDNLWIGSYGGLYRYGQNKFYKYKSSEEIGSISNNDINMITEDNYGNIWVATESGGLNKFDEKNNTFQHFDGFGLPLTIKAIKFGETNKLWITGNDGIYCFNSEINRIEHYDETDGLQGNVFFLKSIMKDEKGKIYVGGVNGLNIFDPLAIKRKLKPSVFCFTDLYVFDKLQNAFDHESVIDKQIAFKDVLEFSYNKSFFTIHFTLTDYYSAENTKFAYKVEGLYDDWIFIGTERKVSFTDLPAGTYRLLLKYSLLDGSWKIAEKTMIIIVNPPWWSSWWFKTIVLFSFLGGVFLIYKLRIRNIKKHNNRLEEEVKLRTEELSERNHDLQESNDEIRQQKDKLEEFNEEILRQSEKILAQQEFILKQNQELEKLVEKLSLSDQAKNLFFNILAHDLKGPIGAINSLAELLDNNVNNLSKEEIVEFCQHIKKSSSSTQQLLVNLLEWARAQAQFLEYNPVDCNVLDLINKSLNLLTQQCIDKKLEIDNDVEESHTIFVDPNMVDTVFRNIISNAIKFTPEGGKISISSTIYGGEIVLKFSDNGIGMSAEVINNIFKLEERKTVKGTQGEVGTGLGMIIVKEFLDINKGRIEVESKENQFTIFTIKLPISKLVINATSEIRSVLSFQAKKESNMLKEKDLQILKGHRILIVEDNAAMRNHLRFLLSSTFEINEAENGQEALTIASEMQPTVVITDMVMPIMNGLEFCRSLKNNPNTSHIPVIILTSHDTDEGRLSGYYAGADIYLTKPIGKEMIFKVILNILLSREQVRRKMLDAIDVIPQQVQLNDYDNEFLEKIASYIEEHISETTLDVYQIVRYMAMSRSVLYAKFKAITGQGVNEFIRIIRLKRSKELLKTTNLSINEIADKIGFNSASYFIRCFVSEYQITPGEFREKK